LEDKPRGALGDDAAKELRFGWYQPVHGLGRDAGALRYGDHAGRGITVRSELLRGRLEHETARLAVWSNLRPPAGPTGLLCIFAPDRFPKSLDKGFIPTILKNSKFPIRAATARSL